MSHSPEIKVIVKSPAHRCEDQTIVCNLDWTVLKLKSYISENFPVKPAVVDQRLIYSCHLLKDDQTLKEIFKPTEKDNSIFKSQQNASDSVDSSTANRSSQPMPNLSNVSQISFHSTNDPSIDLTNIYAQQMQHYQQMYVNYMTQFLSQNNLDQPQQPTIQNAAYNLPMFINPLLTVPNLVDFSPLINSNLSNLNANTENASTTNRLPTDQNINENQAQNDNPNDVELQNDLQNNGWLDMINVFWNILIVLGLLSASYSRTMFVCSIGFCYYLYQSGFFSNIFTRFFGDFAPNLNNRYQPNNEEEIQHMMDNVETPGVRRRDNADVAAVDNQPEHHFVINKFRFFWMVISSLLSSLMPLNEPAMPTN